MLIRAFRFLWQSAQVIVDPAGFARSIGVQLGEGCRLFINRNTFGSEPYLVKIGSNCVIAHGTEFITHDGAVHQWRKSYPADIVAPIIIGNDVYIGANVTFLSGTIVGEGCIVGACSLVKGEFPPRTVIAGNPARARGSVEDFWQRNRHKVHPTFGLKPDEKRAYFLKYYENQLSGPSSTPHSGSVAQANRSSTDSLSTESSPECAAR